MVTKERYQITIEIKDLIKELIISHVDNASKIGGNKTKFCYRVQFSQNNYRSEVTSNFAETNVDDLAALNFIKLLNLKLTTGIEFKYPDLH